MTYQVGSLVRARGREWVVQPQVRRRSGATPTARLNYLCHI